MDQLVDAFMEWQSHTGAQASSTVCEESTTATVLAVYFFGTYLSDYHDSVLVYPRRGKHQDHSDECGRCVPERCLGAKRLLRHPGIPVAFDVLRAYRQLHRVCPKLSIYAQVKALCHLHGVSQKSP